jgi:hypothetical protein
MLRINFVKLQILKAFRLSLDSQRCYLAASLFFENLFNSPCLSYASTFIHFKMILLILF